MIAGTAVAIYEWFVLYVFFWSAGRLFPIVDVYAPGDDEDREAKAIILADSPETLNAILRGWTNPDAEN